MGSSTLEMVIWYGMILWCPIWKDTKDRLNNLSVKFLTEKDSNLFECFKAVGHLIHFNRG